MTKRWLLLLISIPYLLFSTSVSAQGPTESSVSIAITPPELYIATVQAPNFGTHYASSSSQKISSESDLAIRITDTRETKGSWKLRYHFSVFEMVDGSTLGEAGRITIGKGQLYNSGSLLDSSDYESQASENDFGADTELVSVQESGYSDYTYIVERQNIQLSVSANTKEGEYTSTLKIILESSPDYS